MTHPTSSRANVSCSTPEGEPWWQFWLLLILGIVLAMVIKLALRRLKSPAAVPAFALPNPQPPHPTVSALSPASTVPATAEPVAAPPEVEPVEDSASALKTEAPPTTAEPYPPDDLTRIEGIGPKIAGWLNEAGITTFAELAAHTPAQLAEILRDAGHRIAAPDTWPEQAAFAAAGQWDELAQFQDSLRGGRRK